jgi:hypothetical protein
LQGPPGNIQAILDFYFQVQDLHETEPLYEAKLLILGEGGAGKTSLAKKLQDAEYELKPEEKSTEGIEVIRWRFPFANGQEFRVNLWDFGGQEIYHATHQFFLTKRSLYVLVADTRQENTDFYYWLNVVELLSDNSPVIIIKNEKQDRQCPINERQLRGEFTNLEKVLATNLQTNRGLAEIKDTLQRYILQLPHVGTPLPRIWVRVRAVLENYAQRVNYISDEKYFELCQQNSFTDRWQMLNLSSYLHDLGVCLHFQDDDLLKKTVILNPEWGTRAVYKVLDTPHVKTNYGRFSRDDLNEIWRDGEYADMQGELLKLMMRFKLCYEIRNQPNHYIAPQLLEVEKPEYTWDASDNLLLRYTYEFMPKGILTRFIVEIHHWIEQPSPTQSLVWKEGVILTNGRARAEVIESYYRGEIRIRVSGSDKKGWLSILDHKFNEIHTSYERLKYKKLVPCNCSTCKGNPEPHAYPMETLLKFWQDRKPIQCQKSYDMVEVRQLIDDALNFETAIQTEQRKFIGEQTEEQRQYGNIGITGSVQNLIIQQGHQPEITMVNEPPKPEEPSPSEPPIALHWAYRNGLFYLLVFMVVIFSIAVIADTLPLYSLIVTVIAGVFFIVLIGVLQLRMDDRFSEESTTKLIALVIEQIPLLGNLLKPILNLLGKG